MEIISMSDYNDFKTRVTIENTLYYLHFSWNGTRWFMGIIDSQSNDIISGIAVVPNYPLLLQYKKHIDIEGEIMAIRNDNVQTINRTDFINGKANIVYSSLEDIQDAIS